VINAIKFSIEEIEASDQYFDHTGSLRNSPPIIMGGVLMFRSERMRRTGARSSALGTSSHMQSWADYITGTHESSFWKRHRLRDQITQATIDLGTPCPISRLPPPEHFKTSAMPTQDGLRLNHLGHTEKARPELGYP